MANDQHPNHRVVVTGMGAITAQGPTAADLWEGAKAGRVAIRAVEGLPMDGLLTTLGGEVKERVAPEHDYQHPDGFTDPVIDFTMKAAEEALANCGVKDAIPAERWGIVVGTCNGGLLSGEEWYSQRMRGEEPDARLPLLMPPHAIAEELSAALDAKGPVITIDTACAASANAIGYAAELIRSGQADAVLTGGSDAFSDILYSGFNALESLSPKPAAPYSLDREGLSLGEGSGMLVLMRDDVAREHGAPVLAEVAGYGLSADGYHPTAPHPEGRGAARAVQAGLAAAGVAPGEVQYVNSHGTGTAKNDPAETAATKRGLGEQAARAVAVSSTKSMIGHLLGGAGAAEAIVTVNAVHEGIAPPTANYTEPDPECDLDYVPNEARALAIDVAVSNNFAFGGANASLVFLKPGRAAAPPEPDWDRVLITGMSAFTSAGTDPEALWQAFESGRETVAAEDGTKVGRVDLQASDHLAPKQRKRVDRLGQFSIIGTMQALADARLEVTDDNRERIGVIIGTGVGPMESMENFARPVIEDGPAGASPGVFPNTVYNAAGGQVAIKVGIVGPATTICVGHAAGAASLAYAYDLVARGRADAIASVGADTLTDTVIDAYKGLGVVAGANGRGDGFAIAEAGVTLILERAGAARERGAEARGELLGYGISCDGTGVGRIDPDGNGLERAMRIALESSGVAPGDVTAVWSAQTGLDVADQAEDRAIERLFGDAVRTIAPKRKLGEPMGAGASLEVVLALKSWEHEAMPRGPVLVNGTSLGGTNYSLVVAPASD